MQEIMRSRLHKTANVTTSSLTLRTGGCAATANFQNSIGAGRIQVGEVVTGGIGREAKSQRPFRRT